MNHPPACVALQRHHVQHAVPSWRIPATTAANLTLQRHHVQHAVPRSTQSRDESAGTGASTPSRPARRSQRAKAPCVRARANRASTPSRPARRSQLEDTRNDCGQPDASTPSRPARRSQVHSIPRRVSRHWGFNAITSSTPFPARKGAVRAREGEPGFNAITSSTPFPVLERVHRVRLACWLQRHHVQHAVPRGLPRCLAIRVLGQHAVPSAQRRRACARGRTGLQRHHVQHAVPSWRIPATTAANLTLQRHHVQHAVPRSTQSRDESAGTGASTPSRPARRSQRAKAPCVRARANRASTPSRPARRSQLEDTRNDCGQPDASTPSRPARRSQVHSIPRRVSRHWGFNAITSSTPFPARKGAVRAREGEPGFNAITSSTPFPVLERVHRVRLACWLQRHHVQHAVPRGLPRCLAIRVLGGRFASGAEWTD